MIFWKSKIPNLKSLVSSLFRGRRRGRLVRHYFRVSVLLIAGGLITSGILEVYFRYQESREQLAFQQRAAVNIAALKIQTFIHDVETAMKAATKFQGIAGKEIEADYEFELKRLLYLAPAITEATAIALHGVVRAPILQCYLLAILSGQGEHLGYRLLQPPEERVE